MTTGLAKCLKSRWCMKTPDGIDVTLYFKTKAEYDNDAVFGGYGYIEESNTYFWRDSGRKAFAVALPHAVAMDVLKHERGLLDSLIGHGYDSTAAMVIRQQRQAAHWAGW